MRPDEARAASIVSAAWGIEARESDIETHLGLHDFDLICPDGVEALEVTTATKQDLRSLYDALDKAPDLDLCRAQGARSWQITLEPHARVNQLRRNREQIALGLRHLEEMGIEDFIKRRDRHHSSEVKDFTETFPGIKDAWAFNPSERGPYIVMLPPGATSFIGPEVVTRLVEVFASSDGCADNRRKLAKAGTRERHLFLWIESTEFGPFESLCEGELPDNLPNLPEEITSVWVAAKCRDGRHEVWFVRPPSPWERMPSGSS